MSTLLPMHGSRPGLALRRKKNLKSFRPRCESLEDRTVMSVSMIPMATPIPITHHVAVHHPIHKAVVPVHHQAAHITTHRVAAHHVVQKPRMQKHSTHTAPARTTLTAPIAPLSLLAAPATHTADPTLLTLDLKPIDVNLLGLEVKTSEIVATVSAQSGSGMLLGNLLTDLANLLNFQGVNSALNNVLGSVVTLVNSASLNVNGVLAGVLSNGIVSTVPVLTAHIAPVNLNLLGAVVQTSPIDLSIVAHSGPGLILGNVVADLANLLNTLPPNGKLDLDFVNQQLQTLITELNAQTPTIPSSTITTTPPAPGATRVLALNLPPIDLNLLGLVLTTDQIQVNADAQAGSGDLLGNLLTDLLNTLGATPQNITTLNNNLNTILAKLVGVLNASNLILPLNALGSLSQVLQLLAQPNLVNPTGTASSPVLDLNIASTIPNSPPVDVNLLGLVVTTSNVHAHLDAQTGDGLILGNLVYNVSHLLDPGGSLNLLTILGLLGL